VPPVEVGEKVGLATRRGGFLKFHNMPCRPNWHTGYLRTKTKDIALYQIICKQFFQYESES